ncbi:hypothetical protein QWY86_00730 [Pedobacter aquatilis]|uniref:hypothetical protein n=1 Tax=Pedobacter aquatilis TaxID=351343 RepID=UPI0025B39BFF|nr:hypothetical protein [Pedobacter aquatilis]MDN3585172.1 hypothetical protein [Pedobacter aquatilis]
MKTLTYCLSCLLVVLTFGCRNNNSNLSLKTSDTKTTFAFEATYPVSKTDKLETFFQKEINNELPLDQFVDATVSLTSGEKFHIKATEGNLKLEFDKVHNSLESYKKVKNLTEDISKVLRN